MKDVYAQSQTKQMPIHFQGSSTSDGQVNTNLMTLKTFENNRPSIDNIV
jgi:hypothetical protein